MTAFPKLSARKGSLLLVFVKNKARSGDFDVELFDGFVQRLASV